MNGDETDIVVDVYLSDYYAELITMVVDNFQSAFVFKTGKDLKIFVARRRKQPTPTKRSEKEIFEMARKMHIGQKFRLITGVVFPKSKLDSIKERLNKEHISVEYFVRYDKNDKLMFECSLRSGAVYAIPNEIVSHEQAIKSICGECEKIFSDESVEFCVQQEIVENISEIEKAISEKYPNKKFRWKTFPYQGLSVKGLCIECI
jgi:hypothetical protein